MSGPKKRKKYILTDDSLTTPGGETLYRIQAIRSFGAVLAGDLGGFVEHETNLSHANTAWIGGEAQVSHEARVTQNALVTDRAQLRGHAKAYGQAVVCERACMEDSAKAREYATLKGRAVAKSYADVHGFAVVGGWAVVRDDTFLTAIKPKTC